MVLTREQVKHVAELAKLGLSDEEIDMYCEQLSAILDYAAVLRRLDTDAIEPTASVLALKNVMRKDEATPSLTREEALANAPSSREGYFQVKVILED